MKLQVHNWWRAWACCCIVTLLTLGAKKTTTFVCISYINWDAWSGCRFAGRGWTMLWTCRVEMLSQLNADFMFCLGEWWRERGLLGERLPGGLLRGGTEPHGRPSGRPWTMSAGRTLRGRSSDPLGGLGVDCKKKWIRWSWSTATYEVIKNHSVQREQFCSGKKMQDNTFYSKTSWDANSILHGRKLYILDGE